MTIGNSQSAKALSYLLLLLACILPAAVSVARVDVGTAAYYGPPYQPTECYGGDPSQFPSSNLFAAAGDQIWDNGAACGRPYQVRCVNASRFHACVPGRTIQVMIVDYALSTTSAAAAYKQSVTGAALVLSQTAFGAIANPFRDSIRVEFQVV